LAKIIGLKLCQSVLRTEWCRNAVSQKKAQSGSWGPF
jgi:hypothetical protein